VFKKFVASISGIALLGAGLVGLAPSATAGYGFDVVGPMEVVSDGIELNLSADERYYPFYPYDQHSSTYMQCGYANATGKNFRESTQEYKNKIFLELQEEIYASDEYQYCLDNPDIFVEQLNSTYEPFTSAGGEVSCSNGSTYAYCYSKFKYVAPPLDYSGVQVFTAPATDLTYAEWRQRGGSYLREQGKETMVPWEFEQVGEELILDTDWLSSLDPLGVQPGKAVVNTNSSDKGSLRQVTLPSDYGFEVGDVIVLKQGDDFVAAVVTLNDNGGMLVAHSEAVMNISGPNALNIGEPVLIGTFPKMKNPDLQEEILAKVPGVQPGDQMAVLVQFRSYLQDGLVWYNSTPHEFIEHDERKWDPASTSNRQYITYTEPIVTPTKIERLAANDLDDRFESLTPAWTSVLGDECAKGQFDSYLNGGSGACDLGEVSYNGNAWDETLRFTFATKEDAESIKSIEFKGDQWSPGVMQVLTGPMDGEPKIHVRIPDGLDEGNVDIRFVIEGAESYPLEIGSVEIVPPPASEEDLTVFTTSSEVSPEDIADYLTTDGKVRDFSITPGEGDWTVKASFNWDRSDAGQCEYDSPTDPFTEGLLSIEQFGGDEISNGVKAFDCLLNLEGGGGFKDLDTSNLNSMRRMFEDAPKFNAPVGHFDVSNVSDFSAMFNDAKAFNQPLTDWETTNAETMWAMFYGASEFDQAVNHFDTSKVTDMWAMFFQAEKFNQPLNAWDVSQVNPPTDDGSQQWENHGMSAMFAFAKSFNQDLSMWDPALFSEEPIADSRGYAFDHEADGWVNENCNEGRPLFGGVAHKEACPAAVTLTGPTEVEVGEQVTYTLNITSDRPLQGGEAYVTYSDGVVANYSVPAQSDGFTESVTLTVPEIEVSKLEDLAFPFQAFYKVEGPDGSEVTFESTIMVVNVIPNPEMCEVLRPSMLPATSESFDLDGDGTPNAQDSDIDGDGTPNAQDEDIDGDGTPNESDSTPEGPPSRPVPPNFWDEEQQQELADLIQDHLYGENYPSTFPLPVDPDSGEEETFAEGAGVLVPAPSYDVVVEVLNYTVDEACGIDTDWDGNGGGSPEKPTDPGTGGDSGTTPPGAYPILGDGGTTGENPLNLSLRLIMPSEVYQGVESELTAQVDANEGSVEFGVQEVQLDGEQSVRILGASQVDNDGYASIMVTPENYGDAVVYARYTGDKGTDTTAVVTTVNPAPFVDEFTLRVGGELWDEMPKGEVLPYGYHKVEYTTESGNAPQLEVNGPCQVMSTRSIPPQITMLGTAIAPKRCEVKVSTGGYDAYAPKTWVYDVANAMGNQTASLEADKSNGKLKVGGKKTLAKPSQSITNEDYKFKGKKISWRVTSGTDVCSLTTSSSGKVSIKGLAKGSCAVEASAPKAKNKYKSYKKTYTFSVR
jgi:hypothetical protein